VVDHATVVRGAGRYFLAHATLDMDALARSLAVSRATLYRVAGSRDRLLGEALWWLGSRLLTEARRARRRPGVAGVLEVTRHYATALRGSPPFRTFLATEPEVAARVLFTAPGRVHRRFVRAQAAILREALGPELARFPASPEALAYLYIRIVESALYAELLTGQQPDLDLTEQALRALLTPEAGPERSPEAGPERSPEAGPEGHPEA
jgi:hypothetical protein